MPNPMETNVAGTTVVRPEGGPSLPPRVSWGAVFAGAVVAVAIGLMLNFLGAGIAASMVDATARDTPTASSLGIGAAIWLLVSNLIALAVGGYAAARLSGNADDTDATLHGLAVWATAFLISALLLGNIVAGAASTAMTGASSMIGGVARGAGAMAPAMMGEQQEGQAGGGMAGAMQSAMQGVVDRVQNALSGGGDPAAMTSDQRMTEIGTLVTRRVAEGSLSQPDRTRLNALVAAQYDITPEQAQERVQQAEQQAVQAAQAAEERAREAADAAAMGTATAMFAIFGTMLLGALAAALGARRGTRDLVLVRSSRAVA